MNYRNSHLGAEQAAICSSVLEAIGNTPLISLQAFGHDLAPRLYGKLESTNPGGSMKDRAALGMIEWAEREHGLTAGSRIIVCTSGNMGVGMAMVCAVKGYQLMCLVDAKINPATERCLRVLGAEVIKVYQRDATGGYHLTRLAKLEDLRARYPQAVYLDQYNSPAAVQSHQFGTGPEIYTALDGSVGALVMVAGTGGSSMGVARYFKERSPTTDIWLVDEQGSLALPGNSGAAPRHLNGMGTSIAPGNYAGEDFFQFIDQVIYVGAEDSIRSAIALARSEGVLVGGSGGAAAHVMRTVVAPHYSATDNVVALLPDHGSRYTETQFDPDWLAARGINVPEIFAADTDA